MKIPKTSTSIKKSDGCFASSDPENVTSEKSELFKNHPCIIFQSYTDLNVRYDEYCLKVSRLPMFTFSYSQKLDTRWSDTRRCMEHTYSMSR